MSSSARVLVATSEEIDPSLVVPVLAALDVLNVNLQVVDAGRIGTDSSGALEWVMRALTGEQEEQRFEESVEAHAPDVVLCFDVGACLALCAVRDRTAKPFPVLAVVGELQPRTSWAQTTADRYLPMDDESAVCLVDHGVSDAAIVSVGYIGESAFAQVSGLSREALQKRFGLQGPVILVDVDGLGGEIASELAIQLSLLGRGTVLFDAGSDTEAAAVLRTQVPGLGMRAKLFGKTEDSALLWRSADVIVGRATAQTAARALVLSTRLACLSSHDASDRKRGTALEERDLATIVPSPLMLNDSLELLLQKPAATPATGARDGAATVADSALVVALGRDAMMQERYDTLNRERRAQVEDAQEYVTWSQRTSMPAGGLEDLSGGSAPTPPSRAKLDRLAQEIEARRAQAMRTTRSAQEASSAWEAKRAKALKLGNTAMAKEAERNAELERARMHSALSDLANLEAELKGIQAAQAAAPRQSTAPKESSPRAGGGTTVHTRRSSVDEELEHLRKSASASPNTVSSRTKASAKKRQSQPRRSAVDDELEALKRKMKRGGR